jgi:hypothetical protein
MRTMILIAISLLALTANSQTPPTQDPSGPAPRRAWEWTVEERIADRLNPQKIRERASAYNETLRKRGLSSTATDNSSEAEADPPGVVITYYIDGQRNPELFLSYELFDDLLSGLESNRSLRAKQRAFYGPAIRRFGYDEEAFWASLESVSSGYLAVTSADETNGDARCVARYQALQAARRLWGPRLDRLLYVAIAPTAIHSTSMLDRNHGEALRQHGEALRRAEMGCQ